jgi:hypothetical protein
MGGRWEDEDDWVGTPPEGRHSRDQADPEHWRREWRTPMAVVFGVLFVACVIVLLVALT